jgi:protoporphyrinogen/coproporphyrinogen III oxidase
VARRVVIVGGGISGLAAACAAVETSRRDGGETEVVVLERDPAVGGKARTRRRNGWLVEGGPAGYLDDAETAPTMQRLISAAGMSESVIQASDAARRRFVARNGRAREVKANPLRLVSAGVLSPLGAARLLAEPFIRPRIAESDESVFDFAARRIGQQAAERLVSPMMLGIFAGDARRISLHGAFPRLAALEHDHGSLVRGMLARRRENRGGPAGPSGTLTSFREGMQSLATALAARGGFVVKTGVTVRAIEATPSGQWLVRSWEQPEPLRADAVVLACEAWATADLLEPHAATAAAALRAISYPPVIAVSLGYGPEALARFPRGFGCLIPRDEGIRSLGCVWDSALFTARAPASHVLVRVLLGGAVDTAIDTLTDEEALATARADVERLFTPGASPVTCEVVRWSRAIPQYAVGHPSIVERVSTDVARLPGILLAGNALHGIAFAKAAHEGWRRGEQAAAHALSRSS